ncbi:MAG: glycosyltransferase family 4 protein [Patescibacteria group bacterium]
MRICLISNLYPPYARGGAERVVETEARALKAIGHDVCVITAEPVRDDGSVAPRMTDEGGIRVWRFHPLNLFFYGDIGRHSAPSRLLWHAWDAWNPHAAECVEAILKKERPDVVHTHSLKGIGLSVPRVIRSLGIRHVHTLHDVQLAAPSGLIIKGRESGLGVTDPVSALFARSARRALGSPDAVISPSKFLLDFYRVRGFFPASQAVFLPNPAPRVRPAPHAPSVETRFLFLGQIETHKGILLLVEAFRRLSKDRPKIRLDVVGSGAAADEARRAAGKDVRVAFYGKKSPTQFMEMFSKADYAVVPSLCYENAPTVIVESFAYGVPVIVADIGGAAELVRHGENGLVFEAGNVAALVAALKRACDEKGAWPGRSKAARRSAELLTEDRHAERLVALYDEKDPALAHRGPVVPIRYRAKPTGAYTGR